MARLEQMLLVRQQFMPGPAVMPNQRVGLLEDRA
jgi:hypothetical protein